MSLFEKSYINILQSKSVRFYIYSKNFMIYKFTASKSEDQFHILKFYSSMFIIVWYVAFIIYKKI